MKITTKNCTPEALAAGTKLARYIFDERGNHSEAHLREAELAAICTAAFELGARWRDPRVAGEELPDTVTP